MPKKKSSMRSRARQYDIERHFGYDKPDSNEVIRNWPGVDHNKEYHDALKQLKIKEEKAKAEKRRERRYSERQDYEIPAGMFEFEPAYSV